MNRRKRIRGLWRRLGAKLHHKCVVSVESGERELACLPMVLTSSGNPSSHILGEHYLQQETTEDPARSCYGLRLSEKLLSSTSVDEIMYLESKEQSPRVLAKRHSLSFAVWSTVSAYLQGERWP